MCQRVMLYIVGSEPNDSFLLSLMFNCVSGFCYLSEFEFFFFLGNVNLSLLGNRTPWLRAHRTCFFLKLFICFGLQVLNKFYKIRLLCFVPISLCTFCVLLTKFSECERSLSFKSSIGLFTLMPIQSIFYFINCS